MLQKEEAKIIDNSYEDRSVGRNVSGISVLSNTLMNEEKEQEVDTK